LCIVVLLLNGRGTGEAGSFKQIRGDGSLEQSVLESVARMGRELSHKHRIDLGRLVQLREQSLSEIKREVEALKAMIDPDADEKRIHSVLRDNNPISLKQYVVIPSVLHLTWKSKTDLPKYAKRNIELWREQNPLLKVVLYDDDDIERYFILFCAFSLIVCSKS
jgi:mannosyltransferase OCH1-like enzyme